MSLKLDLHTINSDKKGSLEVSENIFGYEVKPELIAQAVRVYLSNQRQGTAHTKNRGEIAYSGAKLYRQKGTGRARHGDRKASIFVGGNKAHGPDGNQNYTLKMSQKMRQNALKGSLTAKFNQKEVTAVQDLQKVEPKTKSFQQALAKAGLLEQGKTLLVLDKSYAEVLRSAKNLKTITVTQAHRLNTYEVLNHNLIVFTPEAMTVLEQTLGIVAPVKKQVKKAKKSE